ncbi:hypothetical protein P5V15_006716 [Pogonomyrmex californicus]
MKLERLPPAYQLAPVVFISIVVQIYNIYLVCITEDTFLSQLDILRAGKCLFLAREDNWPCITFEALSIREKLSLFSLFFAFAVPPGGYHLRPGKMDHAGQRKEIGKGTRKRYKGRNGPRKRTRDVCRAYVYNVYIGVCVNIYLCVMYVKCMSGCVYMDVCVWVCVCIGGIYRFPLRAKRSTCFTLYRNAHYI